MVVRAFDCSRRDVRGEIDLLIQIGPYTCQITFQVMDVNPAYNCLLGQPWIHYVEVGGQLIIVSGEEDILVSWLSATPDVEEAEESLEIAFQALEVMDNAYVESFPI